MTQGSGKHERYRGDPEVCAMLARAEATNRERDQIDGGAVVHSSIDELVRTAICAIECGIRMNDWDCVAEGLAMLADRMNYRPWIREKAPA
jgi:hypothetical protein